MDTTGGSSRQALQLQIKPNLNSFNRVCEKLTILDF